MNYLDYIIFIVIIIGFLLGFKDGLVRKIIGLIGLILGVFLAFQFSHKVGKLLIPFFNNDEYLSSVIAGITIFLVIILIASLLKRVIHPFDKVNRFLNQFLGGVIGVVQISFFLSALFLFLNIFSFPNSTQRENSWSYNFVLNLIPKSIDIVIGKNVNASDYLKKYIEKKDEDSNSQIDSLQIKK
ncbi:MAG: CvpA family protein [Ignavibacteriales bacterium]|nr:CvpA family protein [Ignavibacteriales bacterium]